MKKADPDPTFEKKSDLDSTYSTLGKKTLIRIRPSDIHMIDNTF